MSYAIIIPVRYNSSRLPGKALEDICGKPMIQWVYEQCEKTQAQRIIIATDHEGIKNVASAFGAEVMMTGSHHSTGTDRIIEVVESGICDKESVIINVQGDEPLIDPENIQQVYDIYTDNSTPIEMSCATPLDIPENPATAATLYKESRDMIDFMNPNIVKVVVNEDNEALYFSRSPIPNQENKKDILFKQHIGLYAYNHRILRLFKNWTPRILEKTERLEQNRILEYRAYMFTEEAIAPVERGVDTQEDLDYVRSIITAN